MLRGSHAADGGFHEEIDSRTGAPGPEADLYLEGHDQHRGWFHSSLLLGCALEGRAPYRGLLTHGFTVDGQGRKMSKSLGNIIEIREFAKDPGAEVARLWCASTDYAGDPPIDKKILARVVDSYRRIRNTLRFLLANVADFDAARDAVPASANCWRSTAGRCRARPSCRPRCWRITSASSSTRWSPSCSCSAAKTWARSTSTC